jgi:HEAT repeat protein
MTGKNTWDVKDQFEKIPVPEIIQCLDDSPIEAAYALGYLGTSDAVDPLISKLVYPPDDTVWDNLNNLAIAWALGMIGDRAAVEPLIRLLQSSSDDVCMVAAWALGQIGDTAAIPALVDALKTYEQDVGRKREQALCDIDIDDPVVRTIIPNIVSTCSISKGSPITLALKALGYSS